MGSEVRQYLHITCDPLIELEVKEGKGPSVLMTDSLCVCFECIAAHRGEEYNVAWQSWQSDFIPEN